MVQVTRVLLVLHLLIWSIPAAAAEAATSAPNSGPAVERSPKLDSLGVMYAKYRGEVWTHALALFREVGLAIEDKDDTGGVLISDWHLFASQQSSGLLPPSVRKGYRPERFKLHVFVSPSPGPTRVYVGSITRARHLARKVTAEFYNARTPELWFLENLGRRLGEQGERIPDDAGERRLLVLKLRQDLEEDLCAVLPEGDPEVPDPKDASVRYPVLIPGSKVKPSYPYYKSKRREGGRLVFRAVIREDGILERIELLSPAVAEEDFVVAARGALSFWRYRPATRDGCPVSVSLTIVVDFLLG